MDQVTPNLEFVPKRSYKRRDSKIECFKVLSCDGSLERNLTLSKSPIFEIDMLTEKVAIMLMEDLYYGEYTGV